ncbi:hypothetical protein AUC31_15750 [Planococcus rifietoensis]|uniref:Uncharacterized protein n=1 Tax=Planococcus rifietoensis TaxID=200991 RepID=A0A0U2Z9G5_9BACL|nr:hypothetical protein [Planococcus rifietoensis]ALS76571.1 hypothetical protein AUC31_15750 [Planococcus rifietoensis]
MKLLSTELYGNSPIYLQNLLLSFREYANSRKRYGMGYYRFLHQLSGMDENDRQSEERYQDLELRSLLRHAAEHSVFYRDMYGSDLADIRFASELRQLPFIEEEVFDKRIDEIRMQVTRRKKRESEALGDGQSPHLWLTNLDLQKQTAAVDYFKKQHGAINLEMKRATFYNGDFVPHGQKEGAFWRDIYYLNQRLYSAHHCTEPYLSAVVRNLSDFRPDFVDGLSEAILALSRFINDHRLVLDFQAIAVFVETDILPDNERLEIESAFGCSVRRWSMKTERSPFLSECAVGNLHFNTRTGVMEFTEKGEVLLTRFHTKGTPVIRLKIKDQWMPVHCPCPCGSVHPVVRKPLQPISSFLQSRSRGRVTSLYLATVQEKFQQAAPSMQFVQNSVDAIEIWLSGIDLVPKELEQDIVQEMAGIFGEDMRFMVKGRSGSPSEEIGAAGLIINNLQVPRTCPTEYGMD